MITHAIDSEGTAPTQRGRHAIVWSLIAIIAIGAVRINQGLAAPDLQGALHRVYITDVRDQQFVVSWTTNTPSDGRVEWGTTPALGFTTTDVVSSATAHYVRITGLSPVTTYYFQVGSGALVDNNNGQFYTVTTGPLLMNVPPAGRNVYGYVYQIDGSTPAANTIVYLQIQDADEQGSPGRSQMVSLRTDETGVWGFINLSDVRTSTGTDYFAFSDATDNLSLTAQGGSLGVAHQTAAVPTAYPEQPTNLVLDSSPTVVTLKDLRATSEAPASVWLLIMVCGAVGFGVWRLKGHRR